VTACLGGDRPFSSTYVEGSDVGSGAIRRWAPAESVALRCVGLFSVGRSVRACVGVCVCVCFLFLYAGNSRVHDERRESLWSSSELFFQVLLSTHWRYTPGCGSDGSDGSDGGE
jgi:hypothetical protein